MDKLCAESCLGSVLRRLESMNKRAWFGGSAQGRVSVRISSKPGCPIKRLCVTIGTRIQSLKGPRRCRVMSRGVEVPVGDSSAK